MNPYIRNAWLGLMVGMSLTACATCQRHPVVCTVAGTVVVTSVALSTVKHWNHADRNEHLPNKIPACTQPSCWE